jgi:outer membrane protein assembly factor BamB
MEGRIFALTLKDGSRLWSQRIGNAIWATSSIGEDFVIAATMDGSLIRFDHSGNIIWRVKPGGGILASPLCLDRENLVVFGTKDRYIYAYSLTRGDLMWRFVTQGEVNGTPVSDGERILIGSEDGHLYALTNTGRLLWKQNMGGAILSRPLVVDETVFVTSYGSRAIALERKTGKIISEYKTASPVYSSPAHDGERLYFGSNGNVFYALNRFGDGM